MPTEIQSVQWAGMAVSTVFMFVAIYLSMGGKLPTMRAKSLLVVAITFIMSAVYASMALGQGLYVRGDLREVNWEIAVLYAVTHGLVMAAIYLCLDENWAKAAYGFVLGAVQALFLVFLTLSASGDWQFQWLMYAAAVHIASWFMTLFFLWLPAPRSDGTPRVSNTMHWIVKIVLQLALLGYLVVPILDITYTFKFSPLVTAIVYLILDFVKVVFLIYTLGWVDLWEGQCGNTGSGLFSWFGTGGGLPRLVGVHPPVCKPGANNLSAAPATDSAAAPLVQEAQMKLPQGW